ncbi:MAG TPA: hypothetical protein VGF73_12560 [Chthoniobacterales bacterium]
MTLRAHLSSSRSVQNSKSRSSGLSRLTIMQMDQLGRRAADDEKKIVVV